MIVGSVMRYIRLPEGDRVRVYACAYVFGAMYHQLHLRASVCLLAAAFESSAETINKDCREVRHKVALQSMILYLNQPFFTAAVLNRGYDT